MLRMSARLLQTIRDHGRQSYEDEACGVIYGRSQDGTKEALALQRLENSRDGERHRRFLITPEDYKQAETQASARGLELLGFYHSHPNHSAYPSAYDLEHAWPFFSYVIVSVRNSEPSEVRSFVMEDDRSGFSEEELRIT